MARQTFQVQEIHCDGCENAIRNALGRLEGVSQVDPDHTSNRVAVEFDESRVDEKTIGARLTDAGYPLVR
jgi:copper chaperone CopZ